jgi:hypothetical protein
MKDIFSFAILLRIFYSGILLFLVCVLLREVGLMWFDRQMTFGEVKYFDGTDFKPGAADRFRYLLNQEYNHALENIKDYKTIFQAISGNSLSAGRDLSGLLNLDQSNPNTVNQNRGEKTIDPAVLSRAKGFESFESKRGDFAQLDISFQGVDVKKLFSSVRTYLSPSVDLNLFITKYGAEDMRANIRWPREARPLEGVLKRYYDFEIGPQRDDATLSRKVAYYLLWLQAFDGKTDELVAFDEFCLWIDGISALRTVADEKKRLTVNSGAGVFAGSTSERFASGFGAALNFSDTYRVGANLIAEARKNNADFSLEVSIGARKARISAELLASLLGYYYVHVLSNPDRQEFFKQVSEEFIDAFGKVDPRVVATKLLANRVVPWSKIVTLLQPHPSGQESLEQVLFGERFDSADIGQFGFPKRELSSVLRHIGPDGVWLGTAFLVAPDVAVTTDPGPKISTVPGFVEYVLSPYEPSGVKFQRIAVKSVVPLMRAGRVELVALKLVAPIAGVTPFKIARRDRNKRRTGESIYLLSYLSSVDYRLFPDSLPNEPFNNEFERPVYLGATILLEKENVAGMQYAYDAFTRGGAGGSPVMDAVSGEVIAVHHSGYPYGEIAKIGIGADITALSDLPRFQSLIAAKEQVGKMPLARRAPCPLSPKLSC